MIEPAGNHWFLREGGVVTMASWDVADATPLHLANAYAKSWRGDELTADEAQALGDAPEQPVASAGNLLSGDLLLGMIARHRPEILEAVDALAEQLAGFLPSLPQLLAWSALSDYTDRALGVVAHEVTAGMVPEGSAAVLEDWAQQEASVAAWEASPDGIAAAAALAPDGGPEGWSQVPPTHPNHGCHPARQAAVSSGFIADEAKSQ
jgi:hypothetical protein